MKHIRKECQRHKKSPRELGGLIKIDRGDWGLDGRYTFFGRIYSIKIINVNNIGGITLTLVNNVSINLSCFHVGMPKHSLDGIDICVMFKL